MAVTSATGSSYGGGVRSVMAYSARGYRRYWRSSVVVSVVAPLLLLLAMGLGLGSLVNSGGGASALGTSYLSYVAPGLLTAAALQIAAGEATFPVFGGFKWERYFFAMNATPLTSGQISTGVLGWLGVRTLGTSAIYLLVMAAFGAVLTPWALLTLPIATLGALAFAAPVVAFSAHKREMDNSFNALFRFGVIPMVLFSGTYYEIDQLPGWGQVLAWISPLWHATELARAASLGPLDLASGIGSLSAGMVLVHTAYLLLWFGVGVWLSRLAFAERLGE